MTTNQKVTLGVIGGSGVYQMQGVKVVKEHVIDTPFGAPSSHVTEVDLYGREVFFLARHGVGHMLTPSEVNYRANIYALKKFNATHLLAVSAVGIMQTEIKPGDMVVPDQIFDRTKGIRPSTFFGEGLVGHVTFADPFDEEMRQHVINGAKSAGVPVHGTGSYVCMEGPQFSTRAESHFYRQTLNPAVIGMTAIPEAKLAREAEMCYAMLALATDYDCWHEGQADVTVEAVLAVLKENAENANKIVKQVAERLPKTSNSPTLTAAKNAIMSDKNRIPPTTKERVELLFGKYLG